MWNRFEKRFIFFPSSQIVETPGQADLAYEEVSFITEDSFRLHGWFVPGTTRATWLWFHGNGGNISHHVEELALVHHRLGVNLFILDYRGYGNSEGTPTERGIYRDARAALGYLQGRPDVATEGVVYFGHSLGAAVAVELAAAYPPRGLILASPFASMSDMAHLRFPFLPVNWLVRDRYDSLARIPNVRCPLLVLHGDRDNTVPLSQAEKLFNRATPPKHFRLLPGAGHDDIFNTGGSASWDALEEFQAELWPHGATAELS